MKHLCIVYARECDQGTYHGDDDLIDQARNAAKHQGDSPLVCDCYGHVVWLTNASTRGTNASAATAFSTPTSHLPTRRPDEPLLQEMSSVLPFSVVNWRRKTGFTELALKIVDKQWKVPQSQAKDLLQERATIHWLDGLGTIKGNPLKLQYWSLDDSSIFLLLLFSYIKGCLR